MASPSDDDRELPKTAFPEDDGSAVPEEPLPERVGPYRVTRLLGQGGMGSVYAAIDEAGAPLAVKVMHPRFASPDLIRRFRRESLVRIEHPNVIAVLGSGMADGVPFIAFELLDGEGLERRVARGSMSPAELVPLAVQACRGLTAAHEAGIVHRDLKPANLFVLPDGTLKILDFGVAQVASSETRLTTVGAVLGTPAYLAPEQARGEPNIDARSDVWALGVVLYEALTGRNPFVRDTALSTMLAALMEEPPPLVTRAPRVSSELAAIVERCIRKPREERWQTVADLGRALGEASLVRDASETAATMQVEAVSLAAGEARVVAILLAEGVIDRVALERAIREQGGLPMQLLGDRVVGVFGAEATYGDEVERAARAALTSRGAAAHMAVSAGRASRTGGAISGTVVSAAERGCAAGVQGIAVDAETARPLASSFDVRQLGTGIFELVTEREENRPGAPEARATLVAGQRTLGRDAELAQIRLAVETVAGERRASVMLVTGPAGIGKSRIRGEVEAMLAAAPEPFTVLVSRAEPLRRDLAWDVVASMLRRYARARAGEPGAARLDADAPADERRLAASRLAQAAFDDPTRAAACAEFLGELLGVPMPDSAALDAARRDPQLMTDRIRLAVRDWLEALVLHGPVGLVLEDLQWADVRSLEVIDDLLVRLADSPFFVLGTGRPELDEVRRDLFAGRDVSRIRLRGLSAQHVGVLAATAAGRALPAAVVQTLVQRTNGNPFFVEQIGLALRDASPTETQIDRLPIPVSVEAAIQSRLDHLPIAEKELLKRGSVLRRPFVADDLVALDVRDPGPLLGSLARRDLVASRNVGAARAPEHQLKSTLVADVAYAMLSPALRVELHKKAARHLEARGDVDPEEIALHYESSGDTTPAAEQFATAALAAARRGDSQTVLRCSERALAGGIGRARRFDLHMARADALRFLGRRDERAAEIEKAHGLATTDADAARSLTERGSLLAQAGQAAEALQALAGAAEAARRAGDPELLAMAQARACEVLCTRVSGRLAEAAAAFEEASASALRAAPHVRAYVSHTETVLASARRDLPAALVAAQRTVELYSVSGDVRRVIGAESNVADLHNRLGEYELAERALHDALDGCRRVGHLIVEGYVAVNLGYSLTMLGRHDEALVVLAQASEAAALTKDPRLEAFVRLYELRLRWAGGDATVAPDAAALAAEIIDAGPASVRAHALALAARAHLAAGDVDSSERESSEALRLRDELGGLDEDDAAVFVARALTQRARGDEAGAVDTLTRGKAALAEVVSSLAEPQRARLVATVPAIRELLEL